MQDKVVKNQEQQKHTEHTGSRVRKFSFGEKVFTYHNEGKWLQFISRRVHTHAKWKRRTVSSKSQDKSCTPEPLQVP